MNLQEKINKIEKHLADQTGVKLWRHVVEIKSELKESIKKLKEEIKFDANNEELALSTKAHNQWCKRVIDKILGKELLE